MQPIKDSFIRFDAYNKQAKVGDYVFTYVGGRDSYPIICQITEINGILYTLTNVNSGRKVSRRIAEIAYLPNFAELHNTHPELFI